MKIDGARILVTGASEGIGAALAKQLADRGARVMIAARNGERLGAVAAGRMETWTVDLSDAAARAELASRAGAVDVLVNNAGMGLYAPSWKTDPAELRRMFELNLFAAQDLVRLLVPGMVERGRGLVVNVGSIAGKVTLPWFTLYSASKYALGSFTDGLRMELAGTGVKAMIVCPGYVKTGFQDHVLGGRPPARIRQAKEFAQTADECAADIVRGIEGDKRTVVTPGVGWAFIAAARVLPRLIHGALARQNRSL